MIATDAAILVMSIFSLYESHYNDSFFFYWSELYLTS